MNMEINFFHNLLEKWGVGERLIHELELLFFAVAVTLLILFVNLICRRVIIPITKRLVKKTRNKFDDILLNDRVLKNLVRTLTPIIILIALPYAVDAFPLLLIVFKRLAMAWLTLSIIILICSIFDAIYSYMAAMDVAQHHPIKGFMQMFKIIVVCIGIIIIISILVDKNPGAILTALGASAAVLMLVFKDTIVGLVAGIQLSANDMLRPGDWINMPKYNIDGDVIEVSLTTIKIQNFDKTISTVPPYALISDSFQNWRGMREAGGRRIKRHIPIDMNTIGYLTNEQRGIWYPEDGWKPMHRQMWSILKFSEITCRTIFALILKCTKSLLCLSESCSLLLRVSRWSSISFQTLPYGQNMKPFSRKLSNMCFL